MEGSTKVNVVAELRECADARLPANYDMRRVCAGLEYQRKTLVLVDAPVIGRPSALATDLDDEVEATIFTFAICFCNECFTYFMVMDDPNYSLFDDAEFTPPRRNPGDELIIRKGPKKVLSKEQKAFNRLTSRITKLQQEIEQERLWQNDLFTHWSNTMREQLIVLSERQIQLVKALDAAGKKFKLGKVQKRELHNTILDLFEGACNHVQPDEEAQEIYKRLSGSSIEKEKAAALEILKAEMEEQLHAQLGVHFDLSDIDGSEESFARFDKMMKEKLDGMDFGDDAPDTRRMTDKQRAKEQRRVEEEHRRKRGLREMYLGLAKALHPDVAGDEETRREREELLKQVTVAYKEEDIQTLLRIEMTMIHQDSTVLETLPADTLNMYVATLKEQVTELEWDLDELLWNPRHPEIAKYVAADRDYAYRELLFDVAWCKDSVVVFDRTIRLLSAQPTKQMLMGIVDDYLRVNARF